MTRHQQRPTSERHPPVSWTGQEVPFDVADDDCLAELNKRIREEGLFQEPA